MLTLERISRDVITVEYITVKPLTPGYSKLEKSHYKQVPLSQNLEKVLVATSLYCSCNSRSSLCWPLT